MKTSILSRIALAASCLSLAACGAETAPEETADGAQPDIIEIRQDNFEAISDAFKVIRTQLEGGSPDMAIIEAQATDIDTRAQTVVNYFPMGTSVDDGYDTEALKTIWEKPAEFEAAAQDFVDASATMVTLAGEGDAAAVGAQVAELGGTCKACHDQFRLKTD
jgi:cytochrome c556